MMKYRNMIAAMFAGALTVAVTVQALEIKHKEEVVKLTQKAIDEGKGGSATTLVATAKEARRLARDSLDDRHSYIMQVASDRLKKAIAEGEQGNIEAATKFLQEVITEVTAEGRDTMTP